MCHSFSDTDQIICGRFVGGFFDDSAQQLQFVEGGIQTLLRRLVQEIKLSQILDAQCNQLQRDRGQIRPQYLRYRVERHFLVFSFRVQSVADARRLTTSPSSSLLFVIKIQQCQQIQLKSVKTTLIPKLVI